MGLKTHRISNWKHRGVRSDDYNELYDKYINTKTCEECSIELIEGIFGSNKRTLDHNHHTGQFRKVLCNSCNINRGREDNIKEIMFNRFKFSARLSKRDGSNKDFIREKIFNKFKVYFDI